MEWELFRHRIKMGRASVDVYTWTRSGDRKSAADQTYRFIQDKFDSEETIECVSNRAKISLQWKVVVEDLRALFNNMASPNNYMNPFRLRILSELATTRVKANLPNGINPVPEQFIHVNL